MAGSDGYEGAARRPLSEFLKAPAGLRPVIVGKETGDDLNNPQALIHNYVDPDGTFKGKIVAENAKQFIVHYPEENYVKHQAQTHGDAITRVTSSTNAGIADELGSGLQLKPGPTNREVIKNKSSADG